MRYLPILVVATFSVAIAGCPKKNKAKTDTDPTGSTGVTRDGASHESPEVRGGLPGQVGKDALLGRVFFEFDTSTIAADARDELKRIAETLSVDPALMVRLEGHADERGSTQYNLALSDRRAGAVRRFLIDLGVAANRMSTVGYGEEQPLATGHDESDWSKNRRVDVVLTSSPDRVAGTPR